MTIYNKIKSVVTNHIINQYGENTSYSMDIYSALKQLLGLSYKKFDFPSNISELNNSPEHIEDLQLSLSKINEKESRRKSAGVFYTDKDVSDFMVLNSFRLFVEPSTTTVSDIVSIKDLLIKNNTSYIKKLLKATVFDPTCGAGVFLVSALAQKIELYKLKRGEDYNPLDLAGTIFGNDIETVSTDITKLRLFFLMIDSFEENLNVEQLAITISKNFSNIDVVDYKNNVFDKFDVIVGNPPYIEYGKYEGSIANNYGNVYADVMKNVITLLSYNGVFAFVVPLSYISTLRMSSIRNHVQNNTGKQLLLNFADRPDCLFDGVHQKLTIVFAQNTIENNGIYTSKYHHWYKSERNSLFLNIPLEKINDKSNNFWPKIGDATALSIYNKILAYKGDNLLSLNKTNELGSFFLNLRACFWMKVFSYDMHSNSYKEYKIEKSKLPYVMCLLNSSLFFLMWTIVSDGWHITNKELSFIRIPTKIPNSQKWCKLLKELEARLEETKEFVGTKQVEYEYKHKFCKGIIDKIDEGLKSVYGITETEIKYIKSFNEKYRLSDGA